MPFVSFWRVTSRFRDMVNLPRRTVPAPDSAVTRRKFSGCYKAVAGNPTRPHCDSINSLRAGSFDS